MNCRPGIPGVAYVNEKYLPLAPSGGSARGAVAAA